MICKIIAHGATRSEALRKMDAALSHLVVFGTNLITNHYFLRQVRKILLIVCIITSFLFVFHFITIITFQFDTTICTDQKYLQVINHPKFVSGEYNTHFISNNLPNEAIRAYMESVCNSPENIKALVTVAVLCEWLHRKRLRKLWTHITPGYRNNPNRYLQLRSLFFNSQNHY